MRTPEEMRANLAIVLGIVGAAMSFFALFLLYK